MKILVELQDKEEFLAFEEWHTEYCKKRKFGSITIDKLSLSTRAFNCLKADDRHTLYDVIDATDVDLLKCPNLGRRNLNEIREKTNEFLHREGLV